MLALALTACSNEGQSASGVESIIQTVNTQEIVNDNIDETQKHSDSLTTADLAPIIVAESDKKIETISFPLTDMDYMFLVEDEGGIFSDGQIPWFEYALLGGEYDTYEEGIACYEAVNSLFTEWHERIEKDSVRYGEGVLRYFYRRNIVAFSPSGNRILLKSYKGDGPISGSRPFYEIYEDFALIGSYFYDYMHVPGSNNYTKNLQYALLETESLMVCPSWGDIGIFYETSALPEELGKEDPQTYSISSITDINDTLFYKKDIDDQGYECIGIYTIKENERVFQSRIVDEYSYPRTVTILEDSLIGGFFSSFMRRWDYYKISMDTNEWIYLFSDDGVGSISPDGKYFAISDFMDGYLGYRVNCIDTGAQVFIKNSNPIGGDDQVLSWVSKDKIAQLVELAAQ